MSRELTPKQAAFVDLVAREGLSNTEAYKRTYDCTAASPEQISRRASELAASPKIAEQIRTIKGAVTAAANKRAAYSLADAIAEAEEIRAKAFEQGNMTAAKAAAELKAKLSGHMVERREIKFGALEQSDVEELEAMQAEIRRRIAEKNGGEAPPPDDSNRPVMH